MGLGSEMHDGVNIFFCHHIGNKVRTADVSLNKFEVFETRDFVKVGETRAVVKFVIDNNLVLWVLLRKENGCM